MNIEELNNENNRLKEQLNYLCGAIRITLGSLQPVIFREYHKCMQGLVHNHDKYRDLKNAMNTLQDAHDASLWGVEYNKDVMEIHRK